MDLISLIYALEADIYKELEFQVFSDALVIFGKYRTHQVLLCVRVCVFALGSGKY
jgi:hypothetical protein